MQRIEEALSKNPARTTIYLISAQNEPMNGFVYSQYYKKAFRFYSECEMISAMDDLFDSVDFPQTIFESRSFFDKKTKQIIKRADDVVNDSEKDLTQNGRTTFVVNVQYRQNATWQGTITWAEQNRTKHFRSTLEMLKLMEQANCQGSVQVVDWK